MARRRQIYLVKTGAGSSSPDASGSASAADGSGGGGGMGGASALVALGELGELVDRLARYNTAPDGSGPAGVGEAMGMAMFYGPGFTVEMPTGIEAVQQAIVTLQDEDIAWSVLGRLCKAEGWRMMDPDSGRTFG